MSFSWASFCWMSFCWGSFCLSCDFLPIVILLSVIHLIIPLRVTSKAILLIAIQLNVILLDVKAPMTWLQVSVLIKHRLSRTFFCFVWVSLSEVLLTLNSQAHSKNTIPSNAISDGNEPKSCLGRVFNFKFVVLLRNKCLARTQPATSKVKNSAKVLSF